MNRAAIPRDGSHATEQHRSRLYRVAVPEGVASGQEKRFTVVKLFFDQSMRNDAIAVPHEDDVALLDRFGGAMLDGEHVARADDREHARAAGA